MSSDIRERLNKQEMFEAVADILKPVIVKTLHEATATCLTCDNFNEGKELCMLNNMRPPAKVIAFGCECYINEIPF